MAITDNWRGSASRLFALQEFIECEIRRLANTETRSLSSTDQRSGRRRLLSSQTGDRVLADQRLERILAGNDLTDISYLAIGLLRARAVGRIVIRRNGQLLGYATGFLAAPGVLITNEHVFSDPQTVRDSLLQLNYERTVSGEETQPAVFQLQLTAPPIINPQLDLAVVGVRPTSQTGQPLADFGWLTLNPAPGKAFIGEYLTIIQHPQGERKQICVRENKLLKYSDTEPYLWYQTDTVSGSSGSPVFNTTWDVVALHHQSIPRSIKRGNRTIYLAKNGQPWTADMGDDAIDWIANEGIRISKIYEFLKQRHASNPLAAAILRNEPPPLPEAARSTSIAPAAPAAGSGSTHRAENGLTIAHQPDGRTTILLPLEIDLQINTSRLLPQNTTTVAAVAPDTHHSTAPQHADDDRHPAQTHFTSEARIDRSNYNVRNGYQPDFIGGGRKLPLPKIDGTRFGKPLKLKDGSTEIKYWNYSVVMNHDRRLAFFAAANIRPAARQGKDVGTDFILDDRVTEVDPNAQLGDSFYEKQKTFESANRLLNPFDKGHLTRREDLQWGRNLDEAIRNGDDSFHYTNCAPQHFAFNQRNSANGLWFRLEVMATRHLTTAPDICIINGPVFNAPKSEIRDGQLIRLQLNRKRDIDPTFGDVKIPKMYFKLIAWQEKRKLLARAFVVSQETLLAQESRVRDEEADTLTSAEIALYEVRISQLEKLTGLKFSLPATAQPRPKEASLNLDQPRRINDENDL